ncbi:helix-turn-helix domain-containing protein, partial [Clostridium bornimense]|uniref:helix-turn-helix domain-containing protein n=1 Tax=Clostridium bornimense TaxID=1216932 RepID=UPI001C124AFA
HNKSYSADLKLSAVEEYLTGTISQLDVCIKYEIYSTSILRRWIKKYNSGIELKNYDPKQEVYMAKSKRKTTIEERKEIVKYCIEHGNDYKNTAEKFSVSYTQVYTWVRKYKVDGEDGLIDKRGHHKSDDEVDELRKAIKEFIDYYNNNRYQERFNNLTPMEVRTAALATETHIQYPIPENKRILAYKAELEAKKKRASSYIFIYFDCLLDRSQIKV